MGEGEDEGAKIKNVHFNITLTSILSHQGRGGKWIPLDTAQLAGRRFIENEFQPPEKYEGIGFDKLKDTY